MKAAFNVALTHLNKTPEQFWRMTPAETATLFQAFRMRENRIHMQRAFELYYLLKPHLTESSDLSVMSLFESMPGAYPDDIPQDVREAGRMPGMTPEQRKVAERRKKIKRLQRQ